MRHVAMGLKSFIKDRPEIYDLLKRSQRQLSTSETGPVYSALDRLSQARPQGLTFIQIGAIDDLDEDPTREFVVRDGWTGVLAEADPQAFARLRRHYAGKRFRGLKFVNAAVVPGAGPAAATTIDLLATAFFASGVFDLLVINAPAQDAAIIESIDFDLTSPGALLFGARQLDARKDAVTRKLVRAGFGVRTLGERCLAIRRA